MSRFPRAAKTRVKWRARTDSTHLTNASSAQRYVTWDLSHKLVHSARPCWLLCARPGTLRYHYRGGGTASSRRCRFGSLAVEAMRCPSLASVMPVIWSGVQQPPGSVWRPVGHTPGQYTTAEHYITHMSLFTPYFTKVLHVMPLFILGITDVSQELSIQLHIRVLFVSKTQQSRVQMAGAVAKERRT